MEKGYYVVVIAIFFVIIVFCIIAMCTQFKGCFSGSKLDKKQERSYNSAWKWILGILICAIVGLLIFAAILVDSILIVKEEAVSVTQNLELIQSNGWW